jgi:DNA-binding transcriptional MerR regulator
MGLKRRLLGRTQTAKELGIDRRTLHSWEKGNRAPPSIIIGKRRYYTREMIDQWLRARSVL